MKASPGPALAGSRLDAIDQFRGFAILLMVLANYLAGVTLVPAWLKHAPDIGLTLIDLIAPFFIFAIGLTFGLSWRKRAARNGVLKTNQHFATRFLAMVGIGAILSAGEIWLNIDGTTVNWGVLQAIGAAGLLTLFVIRLKTPWRLLIGVLLLALYQLVLDRFWLQSVLHSPHGGMPGSLSWAAMMILSTVCADIFHANRARPRFLLFCALLLAGGIALAFISPVSKNRVSSSYVLISLGVSGWIFALFANLKLRIPILVAWGRNPMILYVLHLLLLGIMVLPDIPAWYVAAPIWLVVLQAVALLVLLSAAALWLQKKNIIVSL